MLQGLDPRPPSNRLANLIFDVTEGNPFFVQEVYHHLIEDGRVFDAAGEFRSDITIDQIDVPENVRLVIGRRLDRLGDAERKILAAAAVIGRSFSFQLIRLLLDQVDVDELCDAVEKAQQMGLLVSSAEGPETPFTFAHEIVRQTLLRGIALPRRQRLHAGVAHAIERLHPRAAKERAGEIADHLLKAGAFAQRHELAAALCAPERRRSGRRRSRRRTAPSSRRSRIRTTSRLCAPRSCRRWRPPTTGSDTSTRRSSMAAKRSRSTSRRAIAT